MKRFLLTILSALVIGVSLISCGTSKKVYGTPAIDRIQERGTLLVGTTGDYRPLSYREPETGEYWGFGIDVAGEIADKLGVSISYVPTSWPTLTADVLDPERFDFAIGGITITDTRLEIMDMSEGYLRNGKTLLCRKEDAGRFKGLEDIDKPEVRVMVNPGGLNEKFARENLPDATLIIHDVNQEIPGLVAAGEADVMITEILEAGYYVGQDDRLAAPLIFEPFNHGELGV
jgi:cyclohexadienyl dehydratase